MFTQLRRSFSEARVTSSGKPTGPTLCYAFFSAAHLNTMVATHTHPRSDRTTDNQESRCHTWIGYAWSGTESTKDSRAHLITHIDHALPSRGKLASCFASGTCSSQRHWQLIALVRHGRVWSPSELNPHRGVLGKMDLTRLCQSSCGKPALIHE